MDSWHLIIGVGSFVLGGITNTVIVVRYVNGIKDSIKEIFKKIDTLGEKTSAGFLHHVEKFHTKDK